ncbi:MAG: hypothetical protein RLZZ111_795 [Planctomycetota bacterium]|jgi:hypothetical protein
MRRTHAREARLPRGAPTTVVRLALVLAALSWAPAATDADDVMATAFRVRPYLQNPAADAMTIRWLSEAGDPGRVTVDGRTLISEPVRADALEYQGAEAADRRHPVPPWLHSVRVTGLAASTSYPYAVEQSGETIKAILTTAPQPGAVGKGGSVRLFFLADSRAEPESRGSRVAWLPSTSLPGGPRPRWVRDTYPVDQTTGYRMNLALVAARAAESLRAGNPVLACLAGGLVASGGEQRDWDEFWRHTAGGLGSLASRVPIVAVIGDDEIFGGPTSADLLADLGGHSGPASLLASRKFLAYFEHPDNGAADRRHMGRYHRVDFGPVTILSLDATNSGVDGSDADTNLPLDRAKAPHIPDLAEGSEQYLWLVRELEDARDRRAICFVQVHQPPFSSGPHGRPAGTGEGRDAHSGQPLRRLAPLFREHGVRAVFSGHDPHYEHSIVDGVHYFAVGIAGDELPAPHQGVVNERQVFIVHDHAPERWKGDVLEAGGKHYGHVEVDVRQVEDATIPGGRRFVATVTPVHVFPVLDPAHPGEVVTWERREYDDAVSFETAAPAVPPPADASSSSTPKALP